MPNEYERVLEELRDAGVQSSYIDELEKMLSASPIRKERDEFKQKAEAALADVQRFRTAALGATFKEANIKGKPDAYNIPADLDVLDVDAVKTWAIEAGVADPPPPAVTPEQQQQLEQLAEAASGSAPAPSGSDAARQEVLSATTEEEFWAKARAAGMAR